MKKNASLATIIGGIIVMLVIIQIISDSEKTPSSQPYSITPVTPGQPVTEISKDKEDKLTEKPKEQESTLKEIEDYMNSLTEVQWGIQKKKLYGIDVVWCGWVDDVTDPRSAIADAVTDGMYFGDEKVTRSNGYRIKVRPDPPTSIIEMAQVSFELPKNVSLNLQKGGYIKFRGRIDCLGKLISSTFVHLRDVSLIQE